MKGLRVVLALVSVVILISLFRGVYLVVNSNSAVILENQLTRKKIDTGKVKKRDLEKTQEGFKHYHYSVSDEKEQCYFGITVILKPLSFNKNLELLLGRKDQNCLRKPALLESYKEMVLAKVFKEWSKKEINTLTVQDLTLLSDTLTNKYLDRKVTSDKNLLSFIYTNKMDQSLRNLFVGFGFVFTETSIVKNSEKDSLGKIIKYKLQLVRQVPI
jgi:hypothetical protein